MKQNIELNSLALKTRKMFLEDSYSPLDIFAIVNGWKRMKITIIYYPLSSRVGGMCTKVNNHILICINSGTSYGRQRFTLAHELYHILYEDNLQRVICDMKLGNDRSDSEKEADMFASYLLVPYDALHQYADKKNVWELKDVIEAEQFFQISHKAILLRLFTEDYISKEKFEEYQKIKVTREAIKLGYSADLYTPSSENKTYFTTGEYIRKVESISEKELISNGKREEMLLDAFRADIVYNQNEEGMDMYD
ncbi:MAG: ImmA/IrrE family metallo-endopeptidase [Clostridiales bacterium]|nr:ImmA/IrrE family metallo-endopeptidase [Clostridiales bacterium]